MSASRNLLLGALLCASLGANAQQGRRGRDAGEPGKFDYYAVALSWSPAFCATHDDPNQCAPGRQAGFVMEKRDDLVGWSILTLRLAFA